MIKLISDLLGLLHELQQCRSRFGTTNERWLQGPSTKRLKLENLLACHILNDLKRQLFMNQNSEIREIFNFYKIIIVFKLELTIVPTGRT